MSKYLALYVIALGALGLVGLELVVCDTENQETIHGFVSNERETVEKVSAHRTRMRPRQPRLRTDLAP